MTDISYLLLILFWCQLESYGSDAIQIDLDPAKGIATTVDAIHISCVPDYPNEYVQGVTLIELSRNDRDPLVFIPTCGNVTLGEDSSRVQAVGTVDKDPSQSYLNVSLMNPESDDTGIYTCSLHYIDKSGHMKIETASKNLLIENIDVKSLERVLNQMGDKITSLGEKVTSLEKENKYLIEKDSVLTGRITTLEITSANHTNLIDEDSVLTGRITTLEKTTANHTNLINKDSVLTGRITTLEITSANHTNLIDEDSVLTGRITTLEKTTANHTNLINKDSVLTGRITTLEITSANHTNLIDEDSVLTGRITTLEKTTANHTNLINKVFYNVAFMATNKEYINPTSGSVLILSDIIWSIGTGYDNQTGVFTAPVPGMYVFFVTLRIYDTNCSKQLNFMVNGETISRLYGFDKNSHPQNSMSTVVNIQAGDRVFLTTVDGCDVFNDRYTFFSGYLLKTF